MDTHERIGALLRASYAFVVAAELPPTFSNLLGQLEERAEARPGRLPDREFKRLMTDTIPALRTFARNLCRDEALADDLVQDALLKAWAARDRFQAGTSFKAWSYTILRNAFLSQMRRTRFTGEWDERAAELVLSARPEQEHRLHLADVSRALDKLPPAQREALLLIGVEELTYEQTAELHGVPCGTIKSRIWRGREALARLVDGDPAEAAALEAA